MCREDEREGTDFGGNPHPLARKGIGMPRGHTRVGCYHVRYGVVFVARAHAWKRRQSRAKGFGMIADDTPTPAPSTEYLSDGPGFTALAGVSRNTPREAKRLPCALHPQPPPLPKRRVQVWG